MARAMDVPGAGNCGPQMRCQKCGLHFEDRSLVKVRGASQGVTIAGNAVGCPRMGCGGLAVQLVDGEYDFDEQGFWSLVRAVKPDGATLGDYERALDVIRRGQNAGEAPEQIADEVVAATPIFRPWLQWMRQHPDRALAILSILVSVALGVPGLALAGASYVGDEEERSAPSSSPVVNVTVQNTAPQMSDDDVARIVRRELQRHDAEQAASPSPAPTMRTERRAAVGRNAPCSCGSGRKKKHCCGATGGR